MNENEVNLNNLEMWNFINHSVNALFGIRSLIKLYYENKYT